MQWLPNGVGTPTGAVIIYYPYEGIDWTGLAVDTKLMGNLYQNGWAADGPAACAKLLTNPPF